MANLNTVGDLRAALKEYPDDLVIEVYDGGDRDWGVTLMHVEPDADELKDGAYEVLCVCSDTLPTHRHSEQPDGN